MTSHSLPSDSAHPAEDADRPGSVRPAVPHDPSPADGWPPFRAFRRWARTLTTASRPTARRESPAPDNPRARSERINAAGPFRPGEIEYARLRSLPPFDTDLLIVTNLRIMRVHTDAQGSIAQLSEAAARQVGVVRAEEFRGRATVTVELHVGSSMRLEETTPADAQRFVDILNEVAVRSRT
ncbi:hypothetical protein SAMN04489752_0174 [Brevibacterium siliguriense]|uniref:YokE-like PH domain-containing protein n=1 Tax=Brevibacterium siliguriense TaxID=1136497 RepID=A0A1H1LPL5_9MICO|nr:hypothetical protein [Brevibacterium siliguriense]SDR75975.1 hypothetical protein SAMN04489752_0174 [Brevibacterium siliguriense]